MEVDLILALASFMICVDSCVMNGEHLKQYHENRYKLLLQFLVLPSLLEIFRR